MRKIVMLSLLALIIVSMGCSTQNCNIKGRLDGRNIAHRAVFFDTVHIKDPIVVEYDRGYYLVEKKDLETISNCDGDFNDLIGIYDVYYYLKDFWIDISVEILKIVGNPKYKDFRDNDPSLTQIHIEVNKKFSNCIFYEITPNTNTFFMGLINIARFNLTKEVIEMNNEVSDKSDRIIEDRCCGLKKGRYYNNLYFRGVYPYYTKSKIDIQ